MQTAYGRTIDNMYIQSTPSGEIYLFKALQKRGNEWASREDSQPIWMNHCETNVSASALIKDLI